MNSRNAVRFVTKRQGRGFTLIEMILVITLMGIVGVLISLMASNQMDRYMTSSRRAFLVSAAGAALVLLERDLHSALPNSVRVTTGNTLEFVPVLQVARYRATLDPSDATSDLLDFTLSDTQFQVLGQLETMPAGARAVINHRGVVQDGRYIYRDAAADGSHVISGAVTIQDRPTGDLVVLGGGHRFAEASVGKRVYFVERSVVYLCDSDTRSLMRYRDVPLTETPMVTGAQLIAAGAVASKALGNVESCSISYQNSAEQAGLVTISLQLEDAGESVQLLHQVHVRDNYL
jgi:MSHA biogenesis protein MshO